jgi:hypothetical protein
MQFEPKLPKTPADYSEPDWGNRKPKMRIALRPSTPSASAFVNASLIARSAQLVKRASRAIGLTVANRTLPQIRPYSATVTERLWPTMSSCRACSAATHRKEGMVSAEQELVG